MYVSAHSVHTLHQPSVKVAGLVQAVPESIGYGVSQAVVGKAGGAAVRLRLHGGTPHGIVAVGAPQHVGAGKIRLRTFYYLSKRVVHYVGIHFPAERGIGNGAQRPAVAVVIDGRRGLAGALAVLKVDRSFWSL